MNQPINHPDEFLRGQKDCADGVPHKPNMGRDYDRGFMIEYEREQVISELSRRGYRGRA